MTTSPENVSPNGNNAPLLIPSKQEEVQQARSYLRERFIRALLAMNGRPADFRMYENTNVSAVFGSCDREFVNIYVKTLDTPLGVISDALLRTNDIECISINEIDPSA